MEQVVGIAFAILATVAFVAVMGAVLWFMWVLLMIGLNEPEDEA